MLLSRLIILFRLMDSTCPLNRLARRIELALKFFLMVRVKTGKLASSPVGLFGFLRWLENRIDSFQRFQRDMRVEDRASNINLQSHPQVLALLFGQGLSAYSLYTFCLNMGGSHLTLIYL